MLTTTSLFKSSDIVVNIYDLILTTESATVAAVENCFILGDLVRGNMVIYFEFVLNNRVSVSSFNNLKFTYEKADYDKISH